MLIRTYLQVSDVKISSLGTQKIIVVLMEGKRCKSVIIGLNFEPLCRNKTSFVLLYHLLQYPLGTPSFLYFNLSDFLSVYSSTSL